MERSKFETFGRTFGPGCQWSVKPRTLGIPKGRFQFRRGCAPGGASMSPIHFYRGFRPILILNGGGSGQLSILVLSHIERHRTDSHNTSQFFSHGQLDGQCRVSKSWYIPFPSRTRFPPCLPILLATCSRYLRPLRPLSCGI